MGRGRPDFVNVDVDVHVNVDVDGRFGLKGLQNKNPTTSTSGIFAYNIVSIGIAFSYLLWRNP